MGNCIFKNKHDIHDSINDTFLNYKAKRAKNTVLIVCMGIYKYIEV